NVPWQYHVTPSALTRPTTIAGAIWFSILASTLARTVLGMSGPAATPSALKPARIAIAVMNCTRGWPSFGLSRMKYLSFRVAVAAFAAIVLTGPRWRFNASTFALLTTPGGGVASLGNSGHR